MNYEYLEHTADVKFRAYGKNLEEAFCNAAYALKNVICTDNIKKKIIKEIEINAEDEKSLLYDFLEWFIIALDSEDFILSEIKNLEIKENTLKAKVIGDVVSNYEIHTHIKAPTYQEMEIVKGDKVMLQVVVDH